MIMLTENVVILERGLNVVGILVRDTTTFELLGGRCLNVIGAKSEKTTTFEKSGFVLVGALHFYSWQAAEVMFVPHFPSVYLIMLNWRNRVQSLLEIDDKALEQLLAEAREIGWRNFGRRIRFYAPSFMYYRSERFCSSPEAFPSVSVTGSSCALKCKHCGGKVLNTMLPAPSPQRLVEVCREIKAKGGLGCLISGGCLPDGSVPLDRFVDAIAEVKKTLGLTVVVHTGVVASELAGRLADAGVDAALIDIIGSDETIREICQLDVSMADYDRSLRVLHESGIPLVPHVLVGLHYGRLKGEFEALEMIAKHSPSAVIFIALMLIHGTVMETAAPPKPEDIARVLVASRLKLPKTPLVLGCMRPKGKHKNETDMLAVKAGVNAIAFPAEQAIKLAESMNMETSFSSLCCSQIFDDLRRNVWKPESSRITPSRRLSARDR